MLKKIACLCFFGVSLIHSETPQKQLLLETPQAQTARLLKANLDLQRENSMLSRNCLWWEKYARLHQEESNFWKETAIVWKQIVWKQIAQKAQLDNVNSINWEKAYKRHIPLCIALTTILLSTPNDWIKAIQKDASSLQNKNYTPELPD